MKARKKRNESLLTDYPSIISKLCLLTVAGLNSQNALTRIVSDYTNSIHNESDRKPAYEELIITCSQIKNGVYEIFAYEDLSRRCGLPCYTKLASYLITGLKRGSSDFNRLLSEEATNALFQQKSNILQHGERASTKLMGPMMLIFVVILIIVIIPALLSINI